MSNKALREKRKASGLCPGCGTESENGQKCQKCLDQRKAYRKERNHGTSEDPALRRCRMCGVDRELELFESRASSGGYCKTCDICRSRGRKAVSDYGKSSKGKEARKKYRSGSKGKETIAKRIKKSLNEGKCVNHPSEDAINAWRCEKCWFRGISYTAMKTQKNWDKAKRLLEAQGYRCIYSGRKLEIGQNATLDHILALTRGGKKDWRNIVWADFEINQKFKYVYTPEELFQICQVFWKKHENGEKGDDIFNVYVEIWKYQSENNFPMLNIHLLLHNRIGALESEGQRSNECLQE